MPTMASMTVKKNDGTTDIVYDALAGSGGEGSPAQWRQDTGAAAALPVGLRSFFKVWSVWNGPKTARVVKASAVHPYATQDSTTTLYSAKDRVVVDVTVTLPQGIPSASINEAVAQTFNLLDHSLMTQAFQAGYAPT